MCFVNVGKIFDTSDRPGYAAAQLVEALRHKLKDHGFDFCWYWNFSLT
jgi:hypothetical protein